MSKECPIKGIAIYADCLECDNKIYVMQAGYKKASKIKKNMTK